MMINCVYKDLSIIISFVIASQKEFKLFLYPNLYLTRLFPCWVVEAIGPQGSNTL